MSIEPVAERPTAPLDPSGRSPTIDPTAPAHPDREDDFRVVVAYLLVGVLLLAVAVVMSDARHQTLLSDLGRWDGAWYARVATTGYPAHLVHGPSTLGFFPLLPLLMRLLVSIDMVRSAVPAGVLVSLVGGLIATLLIRRLASGWWGPRAGVRAAVLFCLFPGSIVFSMAYAEGLLIPLAAGCILALERRRWLIGGLLAGIATATQPDAIVLVAVCVVAAGRELRRTGLHDRSARASLIAPALSLTGIAAFAAYLWAHTGTPFATLRAQQSGWNEKTNPFAMVHQVQDIAHELSVSGAHGFHANLSPVAALIGAGILLVGLWLLVRAPRTVSWEALTWTLGLTVLAFVSENVAPNPRILITAFPAILVFAARFDRRGYRWLLATSTVLLILTSALTYGGQSLTP